MDKRDRFENLIFISLISLVNIWYYRNYIFSQNRFPVGIDYLPFISRLSFYQDYNSYFYIWRSFSLGQVEYINLDNIIGLIPLNPILQVKLIVFVFTLIAGISIYFLSFHYTKNKVFSFLVSYIYISNQFLFSQVASGHVYVVFYYSLLPLITFLFLKVLENNKFINMVKFSFLLTIVIFLSRGEAIFSYALVLGVISLIEVINYRKINVLKPIPSCILLFLLFGTIWVVPNIFSIGPTYMLEGGFNYPIEEHKNLALEILDTIAGHGRELSYLQWVYGLKWDSHPFLDNWEYKLIMLIIPIVAFSALLFRKRIEKTTLIFSLIALLSIFLAKGPHEPFGNLYYWFYDHLPFFNSLRVGNRLLTAVYFSYAILVGITLRNIKISSFHGLGKILLITISTLILIYPIITVYPVSIEGFLVWTPDENVTMPYQIITDNDEYMVFTVPYQYSSNTDVFSNINTGWKGYDLGTFSNIWHKKPVMNQISWSIDSSYFQKYYLNSIFFNKTENLAKLLGLANVKYIYVNQYPEDRDNLNIRSKDYNTIDRDIFLQHKVFKNQKGLTKLTISNNTTIYDNENFLPKFFPAENSAIIVGGRESFINLIEQDNFIFSDGVLLFADQLIRENKKVSFFEMTNKSNAIIFFNSEPLDLAMMMLDDATRIKAAKYAFPSIDSKEHWIGSDSLTKAGMFTLNSRTLSTSGENNLSFQIKTEREGNYEVWSRVVYNKNTGKISLRIDGNKIGSMIPYSPTRSIKWIKLGDIELSKDKHELFLQNIKSAYGTTNDIDEIILVEPTELRNKINETDKLLENSNRIIFISEKQGIDGISGAELIKKNKFPKLKYQSLELKDYFVFYTHEDFERELKFPEIFEINKSSTKVEINFTKINPTKYEVKVKTDKPFFLIFSDSYHPLWRAYIDGEEIQSIISYSFINGFYIQKTGEYEVTIEFIGQRYVWIGGIISLTTFIFAISYILFEDRMLHIYRRIRKRFYGGNN